MKKIMKHTKNLARRAAAPAVVVGASLSSAAAFAVDHTAEIAQSQTDATANVTAASTAVIAVVAVVFGIGLIYSMLRK